MHEHAKKPQRLAFFAASNKSVLLQKDLAARPLTPSALFAATSEQLAGTDQDTFKFEVSFPILSPINSPEPLVVPIARLTEPAIPPPPFSTSYRGRQYRSRSRSFSRPYSRFTSLSTEPILRRDYVRQKDERRRQLSQNRKTARECQQQTMMAVNTPTSILADGSESEDVLHGLDTMPLYQAPTPSTTCTSPLSRNPTIPAANANMIGFTYVSHNQQDYSFALAGQPLYNTAITNKMYYGHHQGDGRLYDDTGLVGIMEDNSFLESDENVGETCSILSLGTSALQLPDKTELSMSDPLLSRSKRSRARRSKNPIPSTQPVHTSPSPPPLSRLLVLIFMLLIFSGCILLVFFITYASTHPIQNFHMHIGSLDMTTTNHGYIHSSTISMHFNISGHNENYMSDIVIESDIPLTVWLAEVSLAMLNETFELPRSSSGLLSSALCSTTTNPDDQITNPAVNLTYIGSLQLSRHRSKLRFPPGKVTRWHIDAYTLPSSLTRESSSWSRFIASLYNRDHPNDTRRTHQRRLSPIGQISIPRTDSEFQLVIKGQYEYSLILSLQRYIDVCVISHNLQDMPVKWIE